MKYNKHFSHLAHFFLELEMLRKKVVGKIKKYYIFNTQFFENRAFYEIVWKNTVDPDRPQMSVWSICIAIWVPKATNNHPELLIFVAFLLQQ